jgi:hypothetical protein
MPSLNKDTPNPRAVDLISDRDRKIFSGQAHYSGTNFSICLSGSISEREIFEARETRWAWQ